MISTPFLYCNASLLEDGFLKSHMPSCVFMQQMQSPHMLLSFVSVTDSGGALTYDFFKYLQFWNHPHVDSILFIYFCFLKALLKLFKQHLHGISSCPSYVWICTQSNVTLLALSCWNVTLCQQTWYCGMQHSGLLLRRSTDWKKKKVLL